MTSDGTWTYTWEHGRQLSGMSKSGTSISYTYAPDGMRRTKTVGSTAYSYYYNGSLLTHMYKGSQYVHITYDASGNPISMYYSPDGGTYYYVLNQQGDVIGLVNSGGAMVVEYTYDAWGKPITTTGSKATTVGALNPLRYRGYIYDTETGLFYVSSRYYNPEVGRFINADDASLLGANGDFTSYNLFAYCGNNPVMRADSNGGFWNIVAGAAMGAIISGVSQVMTNLATGADMMDGVGLAVVSGAVSGGFAASSVARGGQAAVNAAISAVAEIKNQYSMYKASPQDFSLGKAMVSVGVAATLGAASGYLGGDGTRASGSQYGYALQKRAALQNRISNGVYSNASTASKLMSKANGLVKATGKNATLSTSVKFWIGSKLGQYGMYVTDGLLY